MDELAFELLVIVHSDVAGGLLFFLAQHVGVHVEVLFVE